MRAVLAAAALACLLAIGALGVVSAGQRHESQRLAEPVAAARPVVTETPCKCAHDCCGHCGCGCRKK